MVKDIKGWNELHMFLLRVLNWMR